MKQLIDEGADDKALADYDFSVWTSCYRPLIYYRMISTKPRDHPVEVIVLHGPAGTGKSKYCKDNYPKAYWKQRSQWWDGYNNHEHVVVDEFYGWLPYDLLLRICDRYPLLVETKGGQVQFVAKTIIITSNLHPLQWYKNMYFPALQRRVTKWIIMPVWGEQEDYTNYELAAQRMITNTSFNLLP